MSRLATGSVSLASGWEAGLDGQIIALAWSSDSTRLAAASIEGPIVILQASDGAPLVTLPGHADGTLSLSWSPTGDRLASAGQDGCIRLWTADGAALATLAGGGAWVEHVAWSPDGQLLASAAGRLLRLWSAAGERLHDFPDHTSTVTALAWRPGSSELATGCYGGVQLFRAGQATAVRSYDWKGSILTVVWSPTGTWIATGCQDQSVHVWHAASGRDLQMHGYPVKVRELAWVAGGQLLATGGGDEVTVWNFAGKGPEGSRPLNLKAHTTLITGLLAQRRGTLLASIGRDGQLIQWRPLGGSRPAATGSLDEPLVTAAWSPNEQLIAAGGARGTVAVWPAAPTPGTGRTGKLLAPRLPRR